MPPQDIKQLSWPNRLIHFRNLNWRFRHRSRRRCVVPETRREQDNTSHGAPCASWRPHCRRWWQQVFEGWETDFTAGINPPPRHERCRGWRWCRFDITLNINLTQSTGAQVNMRCCVFAARANLLNLIPLSSKLCGIDSVQPALLGFFPFLKQRIRLG